MQAVFIFAVIFFGILGEVVFTELVYNFAVNMILKRKERGRGSKRS